MKLIEKNIFSEKYFQSSREIPESLVVNRQVGVVSGVGVSPHVPHPHVVTSVRENERETLVNEISEPISGATKDTVLEEENTSCHVDWERVGGVRVYRFSASLKLHFPLMIFYKS